MATFRVPVLDAFAWQPPVDDRVTAPTESETKGTRYIIISEATGVFAGKENQIATAKQNTPTLAEHWYFDTPTEGWTARVKDENANYIFDGSAWAKEDTAALVDSINSLESADSVIDTSIDSLESVDSTINASIDSLESVDSTINASIDGLESVDSVINTSIDSLESVDSVINTSIDSLESVDAGKQDKGTYVAEYGAIEFTI